MEKEGGIFRAFNQLVPGICPIRLVSGYAIGTQIAAVFTGEGKKIDGLGLIQTHTNMSAI